MALKERLNTKGQQLAPNGKEPFNKVEEGLKKRYFTVYGRAQNSAQVSLKYYARNRPKRRFKHKEQKGSLKQQKTLDQT